jgi:hypothetical protein
MVFEPQNSDPVQYKFFTAVLYIMFITVVVFHFVNKVSAVLNRKKAQKAQSMGTGVGVGVDLETANPLSNTLGSSELQAAVQNASSATGQSVAVVDIRSRLN